MALEVRGCSRCCVWTKPPVGAVLGHVAQRNGAVFLLSDPGPSMKKPTERQKGWGCTTGQEKHGSTGEKNRTANAAGHGVSPALRNKASWRWCVRSVSCYRWTFGSYFVLFNRFRLTSAMMRAVDRRRTAAIVLCFLGYLISGALAKTLPEDTATEGKSVFNISLSLLCPLNGWLAGCFWWLMVPLACSDAEVTKT